MLCYLLLGLFDLVVCDYIDKVIEVVLLVFEVFDGCVFLLFILYCVLCCVVELLCMCVFWLLFV